ncbi:MAG: NfeD family protein [Planctomycetota bacterium]
MEFWAFILLGVGLVFIVLEVFFPSFGLLGTIAAAAIIVGGVIAFRAEGIFTTYLVLVFVLGPAAAIIGLKIFPKTPFGKALMLSGTTFDPKEATAGQGAGFEELMGHVGVASTPLRPSGKVQLEGRKIDVTTRGELIAAGQRVRVIRVEGNRIFVTEDKG